RGGARARGGVPGVGRVRDAERCRGARPPGPRARDVGVHAGPPPRRRRPRDLLLRACARRAPGRGPPRRGDRAMSVSPARIAAASELFERAARVTPGGVHSPVRAFRSVGVAPVAIAEARGARLWDAEGREYVDWIGAWGPALFGHNPPAVVDAIQRQLQRGMLFGLASPAEVELAERVTSRVPGCEMVRFVVSGTEAAMSA